MIKYWRTLIWSAASHPTLAISGVRKIASDMSFEMPWAALLEDNVRFEDICYTKAKLRQLERNYWNQDEVEAAFDKLIDRRGKDHSSVSIQMRGQVKDSRSQGYCMQNLVITATQGVMIVDVYYRSTELIQKFLADLIFFRVKLMPLFEDFGRHPAIIRFKFSNVYLSAVFMPIFLRYESNPLAFFKHLEKGDPRFFRTCGLATRRFFNPEHRYTYRTRVKMHEYWQEHCISDKMQPLQRYLHTLKGEEPLDNEEDD